MKTPGGKLYTTMLVFLYLLGFLHLSQAQTTLATTTTTVTTATSGGITAKVATTTAAATASKTTTPSNITEVPTTDSAQPNTTNVTTTERTATTTTTSVPITSTTRGTFDDLEHNIETSVFSLKLTIGPENNSSDIQYLKTNLTKDEILEKMTGYFFRVGSGIHLESSSTDPSSASFSLSIDFLVSRVHNSTFEEILDVLQDIDNDTDFRAPNMNDTQMIVEKFIQSTRDVCTATNVCPTGFTCSPSGCEHMCKKQNCSNHGVCAINVLTNSDVEVVCKCEETYSTKYEGEYCENSSMGSDMILAIVAGVLGAACLLFFLLFIVACVLYYRKRTHFNMSYDDFFNSTYHNTPVKINDFHLNGVHS